MTKQKKPKEKYRYCLPNFMAKAMAKVDMRAQIQASMLSQFLLLIGLSIMVLYMIFSRQVTGFYKFMVIFNLLCGWLLISSYLITTYNQYVSYSEAMGYDPEAEKAAVRKRGNIFKRIIMAIKNKRRKKVKENEEEIKAGGHDEVKEGWFKEVPKESNGLVPNFVEDALKNMEKMEGIQRSLEEIPKEIK